MSRAVFVHECGGAEVLKFDTNELGHPKPGSVLIEVTASGVNFIDIYMRTGLYPRELPFVVGLEGAGTVRECGDGTSLSIGDRVAWAGVPGSYAESVIAPADKLIPIPDGVSDEDAAAVMLQGMTAHYLAHTIYKPKRDGTVLVHAAAGGVGLLLVQMLSSAGVRVIGTCSTEEKAILVREAGAKDVILYGDGNFSNEVRSLTDGVGVDVVYDSVGQATFENSLRSLRRRGLAVAFGQSSGPIAPLDLLRLSERGSLFVTRPTLGDYTQDRAELEYRAGAVFQAISSHKLEVRIGARFPLREAASAHRALAGRGTTGKVLLKP